jgi:hypothetical protein
MKLTQKTINEWKNLGPNQNPTVKVFYDDFRKEIDYKLDSLPIGNEVDDAWPIPEFKKELLKGWDTKKLVKALKDWKGWDEKLGFEGNLAKFFGLKSSTEFYHYISKEYMKDSDDWEFWEGFYETLYYDFEEQVPGAWDQLWDYYQEITK